MVTRDPAFIGIQFYHASNIGESPANLRSLLEEYALAFPRFPLRYSQGMLRRSDRMTREVPLDSETIDQLETDLRGSVYSSLSFFHLSKREPGGKSHGPALSLNLALGQGAWAPPYPFTISIIVAADAAPDLPSTIGPLGRIMELVRSPYGFLHLGDSWRAVHEELSAVPVTSFDPNEPFQVEPRDPVAAKKKARLEAVQLARKDLGFFIRGLDCGVFLGPELVTRLGGSDRVRAELASTSVMDIPLNGLLIRRDCLAQKVGDPDSVAEFLNPIVAPGLRAG